jgi:hypothetical protein
MKKNHYFLNFVIVAGIILLSTGIGYGQPFFTSTPDTVALVDEPYVYDADAAGTPAPTYYLDIALQGMNINETTGVITWTPTDIFKGGKVVVRATNTGGSVTQTFYLYVAGPPECLTEAVAYWKLDEATGPYKDSYGSHDGTAVGNPQDSAGIVGRAKKFPGSASTGITVADHSDFHFANGESFSVSLWFKPSTLDYSSLVGVMLGRDEGVAGNHWWIGFADANPGDLEFFVRTGASTVDAFVNGSELDAFKWYHLVCIYDAVNDEMRMYLNNSTAWAGNLTRSFTATDEFDATTTTPLSLGFLYETTGNFPYDGLLDEVIVFKNKVLNTSEIDDLYNRGISGNPACDHGNSPPLFRTDPVTSVREDSPYSYQFRADDIDAGDVLTYSIEKNPAWLNVNIGTRTLSGTPVNDDVGSDSVVIKVNDGEVDVYQRFLLTVINSNDAPVITSTEVTTVNEEQPYSYDADATDDDAGDNLTFSLQPPTPGWLSVNASTGVISGTPPVDDTSSYTVTLRVTDDSAAYDEQTYSLDILNINDPPQITGQSPLDVDEENSLLIQLSDIAYTDPDNAPGDMTLTVTDGDNYSVAANTITPDPDFFGDLVVNIELSDLDSTTSGQINVTVNPVNDPPVFVNVPKDSICVNQPYLYVFWVNDPDKDELTYSAQEKPVWLTFSAADSSITGTPGVGDIGIDTLVVRAHDGTVYTDVTVYIEIKTCNNIPYFTSVPPDEVDEDADYEYNIVVYDDDADDIPNLEISAPILPAWLDLDTDNNILSGTPRNDQVGLKADSTYPVQLMVSDGIEYSLQTFNIKVININDAPEIQTQTKIVGAYIGIAKTIQLSDIDVIDVDNQIADLTLTVLPGTGYSIAGNDITVAETQEVHIAVNFRVADPGDLQDEGVLNVTVLDNTAIEDMAGSNRLVEKIYPVPAGEYVRFVINSVYDYTIEFIDVTGKTVLKEERPGNEKFVEINTANLKAGLYIYKVYNQSVYQMGRFNISGK